MPDNLSPDPHVKYEFETEADFKEADYAAMRDISHEIEEEYPRKMVWFCIYLIITSLPIFLVSIHLDKTSGKASNAEIISDLAVYLILTPIGCWLIYILDMNWGRRWSIYGPDRYDTLAVWFNNWGLGKSRAGEFYQIILDDKNIAIRNIALGIQIFALVILTPINFLLPENLLVFGGLVASITVMIGYILLCVNCWMLRRSNPEPSPKDDRSVYKRKKVNYFNEL